jgi:hypothetical protein
VSETNITRLSMDEVKRSQSLTDWQKVKGMTEEEIETLAKADPDCQPTDDDFWYDAVVVKSSNHKQT